MYLYLYRGEQSAGRNNAEGQNGRNGLSEEPESRSAFSEGLVRRALLDYAARQELGIPDHILSDAAIAKGEKGKPYFTDFAGLPGPDGKAEPAVHYSVSHSGDWWGCLMAEEPVGFDMEVCREKVNYSKIAERYFTEEESELIHSAGLDAFFDVWVRKEAYVKYLGSGLAEGLDSFSVAEDGRLTPRVTISADTVRNRSPRSLKPCIVKPCEIAEGVKAAYCSAGGNPIEAILFL